MKAYLLSWGLGSPVSIIKDWIKTHGNKLALIPNARDAMSEEKKRGGSFPLVVKMFQDLGFDVSIICLVDYFGQEKKLKKELNKFSAITVIGGDSFVLMRAAKLSGFDKHLVSLKHNDNVLYIGCSAGMCIMAENLKGLHLVDNINSNPYGIGSVEMKGLGFLKYLPVPHYKSNHSESEAMNNVVAHLNNNNLPHKTLRDGEVIVLNTSTSVEKFYKLKDK